MGARIRAFPDRGSATVWAVGAMAALCVVFGVVLAMEHAAVVRHRAAGAADLAALAAADHWSDGGTAACAQAGGVARAQSARLVRCAVDGEISDVTAASGSGPFTAEARARAGPPGTEALPLPGPEASRPPGSEAPGPPVAGPSGGADASAGSQMPAESGLRPGAGTPAVPEEAGPAWLTGPVVLPTPTGDGERRGMGQPASAEPGSGPGLPARRPGAGEGGGWGAVRRPGAR